MTKRILNIEAYEALSEEERVSRRLVGAYEIVSATQREVIHVGEEPHELLAIGRIKEVKQGESQKSEPVKTRAISAKTTKRKYYGHSQMKIGETKMSAATSRRSVWKGPFVDAYVVKKAEAAREAGRNEVIKVWSRRSTILPQFVGLTFGVYNGKKHIPVKVTEEMIGQKFGEYSPATATKKTRPAEKLRRLKAAKKK